MEKKRKGRDCKGNENTIESGCGTGYFLSVLFRAPSIRLLSFLACRGSIYTYVCYTYTRNTREAHFPILHVVGQKRMVGFSSCPKTNECGDGAFKASYLSVFSGLSFIVSPRKFLGIKCNLLTFNLMRFPVHLAECWYQTSFNQLCRFFMTLAIRAIIAVASIML